MLTQGSFLSEIKPLCRSHMILSFLRFAKWLITYEIYVQFTYSRLKNTNFVFSSTNKDSSNQNLAFGLQTL